MRQQHQTAFTGPSQSNSPYKLCWPKLKKSKDACVLSYKSCDQDVWGMEEQNLHLTTILHGYKCSGPPAPCCFISGEGVPGIHRPGGWVSPELVRMLWRRKNALSCQESNLSCLAHCYICQATPAHKMHGANYDLINR